MSRILRFHKPAGVLSQFTDRIGGRATLADFIDCPGVYVAGRLDRDSEGLLLLTDDGRLQAYLTQPKRKLEKVYLAQVEGSLDDDARRELLGGVTLSDGVSRFVRVSRVAPPRLTPRPSPLPAHREARATWVKVVLTTGRNRQVRRTLAAVGLPVLRLIRTRIGPFALGDLEPGACREERVHLPRR